MNSYHVYFMANNFGNVLYLGVTSNLERRLHEHKKGAFEGFSKKYNTVKLVYFEETPCVESEILREKEIKKWRRQKKDKLIASLNPKFRDLSDDWYEISHPLSEGSK